MHHPLRRAVWLAHSSIRMRVIGDDVAIGINRLGDVEVALAATDLVKDIGVATGIGKHRSKGHILNFDSLGVV